MCPYSSLLDGSAAIGLAYDVVHIGDVYLPTGRIYCCDPFITDEVGPLDRTVAAGDHPVSLCIIALPDWGKRVALAAVKLADEPVVSWVKATYRRGEQRLTAFRVDAGLACFMDQETAELFAGVVRGYYAANPGGNYYDDILAREFKRSADPDTPYRPGDINMHVPVGGDRRNVAMFASGLGDGAYEASWGLDLAGRPAMLVADFGILPTGTAPT
jgi:hypothetical protein